MPMMPISSGCESEDDNALRSYKSDMVYILLSTYQGEKFLAEQLESLVAQSYKNWELWIRDDGSQDKTLKIIEKYSSQEPRIKLIKDGLGNQGAPQSFGLLLAYVASENPSYVMLCDQDDIWLPEKIATALNAAKEQEKNWGETMPLLIHTDLVVVDKALKQISASFWAYQHQDPRVHAPNRLLLQNTVAGCASLLNLALVRKLAQIKQSNILGQDESLIPKEALMHDMWIALVASFFGKIIPVKKAEILYRQHGANDVGAKKWSLKFFLKGLKETSKIVKNLRNKERQAQGFLTYYESHLSSSDKVLLKAYSTLSSGNFIRRRYVICRYGLYLQGFLRNLVLFFLV